MYAEKFSKIFKTREKMTSGKYREKYRKWFFANFTHILTSSVSFFCSFSLLFRQIYVLYIRIINKFDLYFFLYKLIYLKKIPLNSRSLKLHEWYMYDSYNYLFHSFIYNFYISIFLHGFIYNFYISINFYLYTYLFFRHNCSFYTYHKSIFIDVNN